MLSGFDSSLALRITVFYQKTFIKIEISTNSKTFEDSYSYVFAGINGWYQSYIGR